MLAGKKTPPPPPLQSYYPLAYSDYHASGGFLSHHLARISTAAVYWDARHIDEGVTFLKQRAQPHR